MSANLVCPKCDKDFTGRENAEILVKPRGHAWMNPGSTKPLYCADATSEQVVAYKKAVQIVEARKKMRKT